MSLFNIVKHNRVFKNATWIVVCKLAQAIFAVIINSLTARYFGPSNFGLINYAASLVAFVTPLMTLGTSDILVNEVIKNPKKQGEILGTSITMTTVSSLCCVFGLFVFANCANYGEPTAIWVVVLYSLLLISQSLEQIQYWFHAQYLSKYVSIVSFCAYLLISIYKIALLANEKGIYWFAVSNSIDHLVIAISLFVIYKVKKGQKLKFSVDMVKTLWDKGRHYILPELMGLVLAQSDRIMLRFICGDSEVGLYSAAYSICVMTSFVFSAIIMSFRPLILQAKVESAEEYEHSIIKLYGIIIYLSLLQSVCVSIFNPLIINILYGESYISAVPILLVIIWYTPFSYIGSVRTVWVLAEDKQKYLWIISFTGMVLNIALNLVLIPFLKGTGAAIATLATQIFTNIIIVSLVKPLRINIKYILKSFNLKRIIK